MAIVVREATTHREAALALAGSGFAQGEKQFDFSVGREGEAEAEGQQEEQQELRRTTVSLTVRSYAFEDHGIGGVIWPAAPLLAKHLLWREGGFLLAGDSRLGEAAAGEAARPRRRRRRVLELGCGNSALVGLAAAAAFGCDVTCTDVPEVALRFAKLNASRNRATVEAGGGTCACRALLWGDEASASSRGGPPASPKSFDLIVGADIVYQSELHVALLQTLRAHASNPLDDSDDEAASEEKRRPRILLAFQSRHPQEEAQLLGPLARSFGCSRVMDLPVAGLPEVTPWEEAHMRIVELFFSASASD